MPTTQQDLQGITTEAPPAWAAWHKPKGHRPWKQVATGATQDEATAALLAKLPRLQPGRSFVLPLGAHPYDQEPGSRVPVYRRGIDYTRTTPFS
jgi:hypothetical protein